MTIFQPPAPAGQALAALPPWSPADGHDVPTDRWRCRQRASSGTTRPAGGLPRPGCGWGREGRGQCEATHRGRGGRRRVGLQRPGWRRALPTAATTPGRREPPVAGAGAGGQPRVRTVQDAVALLLRVHEFGHILQAQTAYHGCARGGAGVGSAGERGTRGAQTRARAAARPAGLPARRPRAVRVSPAAAPRARPPSSAPPAGPPRTGRAVRPGARGRCAPAVRRRRCSPPRRPARPERWIAARRGRRVGLAEGPVGLPVQCRPALCPAASRHQTPLAWDP